ncbi:MAG: hypothetical protein ACOVKM_04280 [Candidatus Planktophila sp.]|jgi:hypothetical protein
MESVTVAAVGVVAVLLSLAFAFLGLRSYRQSQAQNPRTYKRGRI